MTPKAAQTLTLALHELATNAAKYGALSGEDGRMTAEWRITGEGDDRRLVFVWTERGGPPVEAPPSRKGFGSRLIERTLAFELGGKVTLGFARDGLRAVFDLPLDRLRAKNDRPGGVRLRRDAPRAGDPTALKDKSVLVVEDEHLVAQETAQALRAAGCRVIGPMASLAQAERAAEAEDLDAAVLDVNLDGDLVWSAAETLRARGIPFVFTTGYAATVEPPPELAPAPRIEKPVPPQRLIATLAAVVGSSSTE